MKFDISRRIRAVTAKKCTKKCDARAKLYFHLLKLFSFFDVLPTDMKVVEPAKHGHHRDGPKYDTHKEIYKETTYRKFPCHVFDASSSWLSL